MDCSRTHALLVDIDRRVQPSIRTIDVITHNCITPRRSPGVLVLFAGRFHSNSNVYRISSQSTIRRLESIFQLVHQCVSVVSISLILLLVILLPILLILMLLTVLVLLLMHMPPSSGANTCVYLRPGGVLLSGHRHIWARVIALTAGGPVPCCLQVYMVLHRYCWSVK